MRLSGVAAHLKLYTLKAFYHFPHNCNCKVTECSISRWISANTVNYFWKVGQHMCPEALDSNIHFLIFSLSKIFNNDWLLYCYISYAAVQHRFRSIVSKINLVKLRKRSIILLSTISFEFQTEKRPDTPRAPAGISTISHSVAPAWSFFQSFYFGPTVKHACARPA